MTKLRCVKVGQKLNLLFPIQAMDSKMMVGLEWNHQIGSAFPSSLLLFQNTTSIAAVM